MSFFEKNIKSLNLEIASKIPSNTKYGNIEYSSNGHPNLCINKIWLHSKIDPWKEAERLIETIKKDSNERIIFFLGGGLGYSILSALKNDNYIVFWAEPDPEIFRYAFEAFDFSEYLSSDRLRLFFLPFDEDTLYERFKGKGTTPISFLSNRSSTQLFNKELAEAHDYCEKFFKKKDANLATLSRFEKTWTKNILQNIPEILHLTPIHKIFRLFDSLPILVIGAGPSLYHSLDDIYKYKDEFIMISVDTALSILEKKGIEPDLVYSVDPQYINSHYTESYQGNSLLVFDPTCTYLGVRNRIGLKKGFVTSSPFPLIQLISVDDEERGLGSVPFGGSVSTNAVSLANLMGGNPVFFVGQDLAFSNGLAHSKGAILESRVFAREHRKYRMEQHNYQQIYSLPKILQKGKNNISLHTNDKLMIFKKWFQDNKKNQNWINLSFNGLELDGIPFSDFSKEFLISKKNDIIKIRKEIKEIQSSYIPTHDNIQKTKDACLDFMKNLNSILPRVEKGIEASKFLYNRVKDKPSWGSKEFQYLKTLEELDLFLQNQKKTNEMLGSALQRVILMIVEGYESQLSLEEKSNEQLSIMRKSILLYEGWRESILLIRRYLKITLLRMEI